MAGLINMALWYLTRNRSYVLAHYLVMGKHRVLPMGLN